MPISKGEYRVGVNFNPSKQNLVSDLKALSANFIDIIDEISEGGGDDTERASEIRRLKALAQTAIEEGAMWAVKAATKGSSV